jgi:hypothetical protein
MNLMRILSGLSITVLAVGCSSSTETRGSGVTGSDSLGYCTQDFISDYNAVVSQSNELVTMIRKNYYTFAEIKRSAQSTTLACNNFLAGHGTSQCKASLGGRVQHISYNDLRSNCELATEYRNGVPVRTATPAPTPVSTPMPTPGTPGPWDPALDTFKEGQLALTLLDTYRLRPTNSGRSQLVCDGNVYANSSYELGEKIRSGLAYCSFQAFTGAPFQNGSEGHLFGNQVERTHVDASSDVVTHTLYMDTAGLNQGWMIVCTRGSFNGLPAKITAADLAATFKDLIKVEITK